MNWWNSIKMCYVYFRYETSRKSSLLECVGSLRALYGAWNTQHMC
jgi:hypothetical protein